MRFIKILFLAVLALCLVIIGFANSQPVTLTLLTDELASYVGFNYSLQLPVFGVVFASVVAGLLIGFIWEWLREYKYRSEGTTNRRDKVYLEAELKKMKKAQGQHDDDVLALLEDSGRKSA